MKNDNCQMKAQDVEKIDLSRFNEGVLKEHMMKIMFGCGLYAAFRGSKEHVFFAHSMVSFGQYPLEFEMQELQGKRFVYISNMPTDKTHTLSVTNSYTHDMGSLLRFPIVPEDPADFGASLERYVRKMAPGQLRMYCREAPQGKKAEMTLQGFPEAEMYPDSPLGKTILNSYFKEGARILGLPESFKPHSLRAACITKMANDQSVSLAETMMVARHSSVSASKTYQRVDGVSEGNRLRALGLLKKVPVPVPPVVETTGDGTSSRSSTPKPTIVELDEFGEPISGDETGSVPEPSTVLGDHFPLTQIGIDNLKGDIAELKSLMAPRKRPEPKKPSANQIAIMELREIVSKLKKELESRDHDILYYRSMDHDNDVKVSGLRMENSRLRQELTRARKEIFSLKRENRELNRFVFEGQERSRF